MSKINNLENGVERDAERKQRMQESLTDKEEMTAVAKDEGHDTDDKEEQIKGHNRCTKQLVGQ